MSVDIIYDPIPANQLDQFMQNAYSTNTFAGTQNGNAAQQGALPNGKLSDPYPNYDHFTNKGQGQGSYGNFNAVYSTSSSPPMQASSSSTSTA